MHDTLQITLTPADQDTLQAFIQHGQVAGRILTRARILLKASEGWTDAELTRAFDVCQKTVRCVRLRFAQGGLQAVLHDRVQARRRQALTGEQAAHLIATACTPAPEGHDHWTVRLLAAKAVELGFVESIALETIQTLLKKTNSNPGSISRGACPKSARPL